MCLNAVTRLQDDLLPVYKYIKHHPGFHKNLVTDRSHSSYYWNDKTHTSLGHSLLVDLENDTCIKYSMSPQAYKVVTTHSN